MKRFNILIVFSLLIVLVISVASYSASISGCRAKCNIDDACKGIKVDSKGQPIGCSSSCSGDCVVCKNGTSKGFCEYTGTKSDTCTSDTGAWTKCGDEYKRPCSGTSSPCSCSGSDTYVDGDCEIHNCS